MTRPNTVNPPRLAPPGAGVPAIERIVGGLILSVHRCLGTPASMSSRFERERGAIAALCAGRNDATLSSRVLIPRLRGLEDSSRFWSVYMTLDHLRIVNDAIDRAIGDLVQNRMPDGTASTAAVKPSDRVGSEVVAAYESSCDTLATMLAAGVDFRTTLRYAHPWFGPLDAAGWSALSAIHMGIHRVQIKRILRDGTRGGA